jgi:phosphopantetheinyl transferase
MRQLVGETVGVARAPLSSPRSRRWPPRVRGPRRIRGMCRPLRRCRAGAGMTGAGTPIRPEKVCRNSATSLAGSRSAVRHCRRRATGDAGCTVTGGESSRVSQAVLKEAARAGARPSTPVGVTIVGVSAAESVAAFLTPADTRELAALRGRRRDQAASARALLRSRLRSEACPAAEDPIRRDCLLCWHPSHGRPYLDGSSVQFSVSHSGAFVAIAVSVARVGLDIEDARTARAGAGARAAMGLRVDREPSTPGGWPVLEQWVRHEAFVKCTGEGLAVPLSSIVLERASSERGWHARRESSAVPTHRVLDLPQVYGCLGAVVVEGNLDVDLVMHAPPRWWAAPAPTPCPMADLATTVLLESR